MRTFSVLLTLLYFCTAPRPSSGEEIRQVKCDIHLTSATLKPGAKGEIIVSFTPEEGTSIQKTVRSKDV